MSFSDIIKNSVLEKFQAGDLTTTTVVLTLAIAVAAGLFIYLVYRLNSRSGFLQPWISTNLLQHFRSSPPGLCWQWAAT